MDYVVCKNKTKMFKIIVILLLWYLFLVSCAPELSRPPLWIRSLETLPPVKGFSRAGVFTINKKIYVQYCDPEGNQIWMRYNEKTHTWRQSRYNSFGCARGENSTGPDAG